jgi:carbon monoxide dehydrogenase subunit G
MKVTGTSTLAADRATVYAALNDPAVLVRTIPGCQRLEALGDDAYAMTVAAGVGSIKGVYDGQVRLADHQEPGSFTLHAQGAGAAGTIGAEVAVTLAETPGGGTALTYDADATVGGMIGGVGQRMLTGVSKRMAAEFFANVEALLSTGVTAGYPDGGGAPEPSGASRLPPGPSTVAPPPSVRPAPSAAAGAVFTAPQNVKGEGPTFLQGVVVGAAAALLGAVVGGWIAGRRG